MLVIVGTVPDADYPVVGGEVAARNGELAICGQGCEINRGTPALAAAALAVSEVMGRPAPFAWLAGDEGLGQGSRELYSLLSGEFPGPRPDVIVFHYLQPDVDWHNKVLFSLQAMAPRPTIMADAGFMYAAKMSGQAGQYDLFTPDAGELAFLADEAAPHPFYTRGFILQEDDRVPELAARAYTHDNAARLMLVKGRVDHILDSSGVVATVDGPSQEAMEAMGGTGDTVTGMVAALAEAGLDLPLAARVAARANRLAGDMARPTPASQVAELIAHIPAALEKALAEAAR